MRADVQSAEVAVARRALSLVVRMVDAERLVIWYHEPALVENARLQCVPPREFVFCASIICLKCLSAAVLPFDAPALPAAPYREARSARVDVGNLKKKPQFIKGMKGARFDLVETSGGAASSTSISPKLHQEFCLPYDRKMHGALHALGSKMTYHTCGA